MTFPYLIENVYLIKIIMTLILVSTNSLAFYTFANSQNDFMFIGILNHFCKLSLFMFIIYELSKFFNIFMNNIFKKLVDYFFQQKIGNKINKYIYKY